MILTVDQTAIASVIRLEGEVTMSSAAELKSVLLEALAGGKEVHLEIEQATEMDVAILQLLWAAERESQASGVGLRLVGRIPEVVAAAIGDAGLERFPALAGT